MRRRIPKAVRLKTQDVQKSPSVRLDAPLPTDPTAVQAQWVMIAREGIFLGYNGGDDPFQFTRQTFDEIVANVRNHPSFVANEAGEGTANVVPWDFDHASEAPAVAGTLPFTGAPAQGWTLDAQVRDGAKGAELWALTRFLDTARNYVRAGQYQWASVAVSFDATHPVTGMNVGALMSSIALTNTPFIEGMDKLVASRRRHVEGFKPTKVTLRHWFEAADSPMDAVRMLKEMFGMSETAGLPEIFTELAKVTEFIVNGAPAGVNLEDLVGGLRQILNLPALTPEAETVATAIAQLQTIVEAEPAPAPAPTNDGPLSPDAAVAASKEIQDMEDFLKLLASKLGVRETEASVTAAIAVLLDTSNGLVKILKLAADTGSERILASATDAAKARETLTGIFAALEVEDAAGSVDRIANLMKQATELEAAMPELAAFRDEKVKSDEAEEETDVDSAIAANRFPDSLKPALLLQRKEMGHAKFVESFPVAAAPVAPALPVALSTPLATAPGGTQLKVEGGRVVKVEASRELPTGTGGEVIDLAIVAGANFTEKAFNHLKLSHANWDKLEYDQQMEMTFNFKAQKNVICSVGA